MVIEWLLFAGNQANDRINKYSASTVVSNPFRLPSTLKSHSLIISFLQNHSFLLVKTLRASTNLYISAFLHTRILQTARIFRITHIYLILMYDIINYYRSITTPERIYELPYYERTLESQN